MVKLQINNHTKFTQNIFYENLQQKTIKLFKVLISGYLFHLKLTLLNNIL